MEPVVAILGTVTRGYLSSFWSLDVLISYLGRPVSQSGGFWGLNQHRLG